MTLRRATLAFAFICSASAPGLAAACGATEQGFPGFLAQVRKEAVAQGVSGEALAMLDAAKYDVGIIKRDETRPRPV